MNFHCLLSLLITTSSSTLLNEIGHYYAPSAQLDDMNSMAIDPVHNNIYTANTRSGTIDILSLSSLTPTSASLTSTRSIDITLQSSPYFTLDYIPSLTYSPAGYIVGTLIPFNYAQVSGWLVLIDTSTNYIKSLIELQQCFSPKHVISSSDGLKLIVACEGLSDSDTADPAGSITVIDLSSDTADPSVWKIYNVDFSDFDDGTKTVPSDVYLPRPNSAFSVNAEPEFLVMDDNDRYVYVILQENNAVAIVDVAALQVLSVFSFGVHDFGFSGLDASDVDGGININKYANVYGLRQPDAAAFFRSSGKQFLLTANEGNPKYYDSLRVNQVSLSVDVFGGGSAEAVMALQEDSALGRLQVLNGKGQNAVSGEYEELYTFGSRDFTVWEVVVQSEEVECPCEYPYGMRMVYSSYDDFEQVTAAVLGPNAFNSDFQNPSADARSDDKGPEPETIVVGQCSNGASFAFIGLERVGGIMVYDITDIATTSSASFVEYINTRDFDVPYSSSSRPPETAGDVEPETIVFLADTNTSSNTAYLVVGYKTSASLGIYSFDCSADRSAFANDAMKPSYLTNSDNTLTTGTADQCDDQLWCLDVDLNTLIIQDIQSGRRLAESDSEQEYEVCLTFNQNKPFCGKESDHFSYGVSAEEELLFAHDDSVIPLQWFANDQLCETASCGEVVSFAIRDGDGCAGAKDLADSMDGVELSCQAGMVTDSCLWSVAMPDCAVSEGGMETTSAVDTVESGVSSTGGDEGELENGELLGERSSNQVGDDSKTNENELDKTSETGSHFYESTVFFVLLAVCVLLCAGVVAFVYKNANEVDDSKEPQIEGDVEEQADAEAVAAFAE